MIKLELNALYEHLSKKKFDPVLQDDLQQVLVVLDLHEQDVPLYINIDESGDLLQFTAIMPYELSLSAMPDISRWLHLLNKELDLPGFCMDDIANVIFYRLSVPCHKGIIANELFKNLLQSVQVICQAFLDSITSIQNEGENETSKKTKKSSKSKIIKF